MSTLPIITIPDPVLRQEAEQVERIDDDLKRLIDDMFDTMYEAPGIGLAAPQIGVLRRLVVMDPARDDDEPEPLVMINPTILERSEAMRSHEEGCLSIPEQTAEIERPAIIRVSYLDAEGKPQEGSFEDLWSTLVQHEVDHLNGVLFIDYLSRLKRDMIVRKLTKSKKAEVL
ncbi:peptide deformylase [Methyloligella sp. 2.7D]|uniref:peptide deformylase n=1 Tax=unclassified Methyloligella TaxID=2625955 RepID=UPI00157CE6FD|nr:peptide deformylase [Methyloligella sp. GL2]QKP78561.1 peptide deformylase [Methyloligella sp. GL2]